jgi:hypothetical protein
VRLEHIRQAHATLDPDVTENYTVEGMPSVAGLAKAMGWTPEEGEIREAIRMRRRVGTLEDAGDAIAARMAPAIPTTRTKRQITPTPQGDFVPEPVDPENEEPLDRDVATAAITMNETGASVIDTGNNIPLVGAQPPVAAPAVKPPIKIINKGGKTKVDPADTTVGAVDL